MLSVEEASRYAGGFDDPARLVSAFAGVAPSVSSNGISIHSNAPHLLQWRLEDVEIPNPNHFADIATLRKGGKVDDYFIIHLLRPSKAPEVKITLKSSYLMCENEPRFVLHGREGSYVKYGLDPQEAALTEGALPGTPHWGEEDKSFWGLLHTERDGKVVREPYPSLPGDYAAFYENIYRHIRHGEPLQSDAREVVGVIRLIEAAWESSRMQRVVRI